MSDRLPARFDEFADVANDANVARLALDVAREELARAQAYVRSCEIRARQAAQATEILRREIFEHEAVAA